MKLSEKQKHSLAVLAGLSDYVFPAEVGLNARTVGSLLQYGLVERQLTSHDETPRGRHIWPRAQYRLTDVGYEVLRGTH